MSNDRKKLLVAVNTDTGVWEDEEGGEWKPHVEPKATEDNMEARRASWRTPDGEAAWDALFESMKPMEDVGDYKDAFLAGYAAAIQQNRDVRAEQIAKDAAAVETFLLHPSRALAAIRAQLP